MDEKNSSDKNEIESAEENSQLLNNNNTNLQYDRHFRHPDAPNVIPKECEWNEEKEPDKFIWDLGEVIYLNT